MTPREVIPAEITDEHEGEVSAAFKKLFDDLRAFQARSGQGPWRLIETAPRDGTEILIYDQRTPSWGVIDFAYWWENHWHIPVYDSNATNATHWMPLPDPPKASNAP
jgi:hypothetical protein